MRARIRTHQLNPATQASPSRSRDTASESPFALARALAEASRIEPQLHARGRGSQGALLQLQRTVGNRAVVNFMSGRVREAEAKPETNRVAQRSLAVDDVPITDVNTMPPEVSAAFARSRTPLDVRERIIKNAILDTGSDVKVTPDGLVGLVDEVAARLQAQYAGQPVGIEVNRYASRLAERMSQDTISGSLKVKGKPGPRFRYYNVAQSLKTPSSTALAGFLEMHPDFHQSVKGVGFDFLSSQANKLGGLYQDNTVHIAADNGQESPETFMKLLLHEIGHATFQKMLLNVRTEPLGEDAAKDKPGKSTEVDELAKELEARISPLNADGKLLYNAWMTLKKNGGQNLFAVGIGSVANVQGRRDYQIGSFNEFCAETFMHVVNAGPAWKQHVQDILASPEDQVPKDQQEAWRAIMEIMDRYVPQITGRTKALALAG